MKHYFFLTFFILLFAQLVAQTPETPVIQSVTIDHNRRLPVVNWTVQDLSLIDGFVVKRMMLGIPGFVDSTYNTIVTINDKNQRSFTDTTTVFGGGLDANRMQYFYSIISFYQDGNGIPQYSNLGRVVSTVWLEAPVTDICEATVELSWTPHQGWDDQLRGYVVKYATTNIYPDQVLDTLTADKTTFTHNNVLIDNNYYYVVEAINKDGTTVQPSNIVVADMFMPDAPQFLIADYATVSKLGEVSLAFTLDPKPSIESYKLMHYAGYLTNNEFQILAEFPNTNQTEIIYKDAVATSTYSKQYKMVAVNICGDDYLESNKATNILLNAAASNDVYALNKLRWNLYGDWPQGIDRQELYRQVDGGAMELIATLSATENTYADDVSLFAGLRIGGILVRGKFCYTLVAYQAGAGSKGISRSNLMCVQQKPKLFLPNAFSPNSAIDQNRVFMPVISFLDNFTMIIYNRWGEKLFETNSVDKPWNGTDLSGKPVQQGTYVYYIRYQYADNDFIEETGHVTVIY